MNRLSARTIAHHTMAPAYDWERRGHGIVHLGLGAFHRAHQAVYTDTALRAEGGDWRIVGASLRSTESVDALNAQDGLFTVLERSERGTRARIIGSLKAAIAARREPEALLHILADPATRIVSLTVTEKAYGIDRASLTVQEDHPAVAADLARPDRPQSVLGYLVEGVRRRQRAGIAPFTVLCCDNLPHNGRLLRAGVLDFAGRIDVDLAAVIEDTVSFPSTMVDRITPAPTEQTRSSARNIIGLDDAAAIETEPFAQWVIEDRFPSGRPHWEAGGAVFTGQVAPYENMKLRMLNGTHSLLAYAAHVAGLPLVRDAMADAGLARVVRRHLAAAARTLEPLSGIAFADYAEALADRFANPAIAHQTYQIAMDGTEKLPQRILMPAVDTMTAGGDLATFAFAVAAWMRYGLRRTDTGQTYALRDPRAEEIEAATLGANGDPNAVSDALHALPGLFPHELSEHSAWRTLVVNQLGMMMKRGMRAAIEAM